MACNLGKRKKKTGEASGDEERKGAAVRHDIRKKGKRNFASKIEKKKEEGGKKESVSL